MRPASASNIGRDLLLAIGVGILLFAATAPTLTWLQFASGSENLNTATALEIRRSGNWLFPTLQGQPRLAKPPLTAWITAGLIRPATLAGISSSDLTVREAAYRALEWDVRWPALVAACLAAMATYGLGRLIGDWRLGVLSALICGTSYAFLRFARSSSTDVQLLLWVSVGNLMLANAVLRGRWWSGCIGAGLALGLAFMSKGPVALVQSVLPVVFFLIWRGKGLRLGAEGSGFGVQGSGFRVQGSGERGGGIDGEAIPSGGTGGLPAPAASASALADKPPVAPVKGVQWFAVAVGAMVLLAVALPWFAAAALRGPGSTWTTWVQEVTRAHATDLPPGGWYNYLILFPLMLPWLVFFVGGIILAAQATWERRGEAGGIVLAFFLLVVPVLTMSLFPDRKDRYLLPMVAPAAVLAAYALLEHLSKSFTATRGPSPCPLPEYRARVPLLRVGLGGLDRLAAMVHWGIVAAIAIVLPILGATRWIQGDDAAGQTWYSMGTGIILGAVGLAILLAGIMWDRRRAYAIIGTTVLVMFFIQSVYIYGYGNTGEGRSAMRPFAAEIRGAFPIARTYSFSPGRRAPQDLSIYLNRTVAPVEALTDVPVADGAAVLVVFQRKGNPEPELPQQWRHFAAAPDGRHRWHAYYLQTGPKVASVFGAASRPGN